MWASPHLLASDAVAENSVDGRSSLDEPILLVELG
jgi:hypothetical protein